MLNGDDVASPGLYKRSWCTNLHKLMTFHWWYLTDCDSSRHTDLPQCFKYWNREWGWDKRNCLSPQIFGCWYKKFLNCWLFLLAAVVVVVWQATAMQPIPSQYGVSWSCYTKANTSQLFLMSSFMPEYHDPVLSVYHSTTLATCQ